LALFFGLAGGVLAGFMPATYAETANRRQNFGKTGHEIARPGPCHSHQLAPPFISGCHEPEKRGTAPPWRRGGLFHEFSAPFPRIFRESVHR
jgi:hypothetical protein